jgi:hypothetical protein
MNNQHLIVISLLPAVDGKYFSCSSQNISCARISSVGIKASSAALLVPITICDEKLM